MVSLASCQLYVSLELLSRKELVLARKEYDQERLAWVALESLEIVVKERDFGRQGRDS